jgi:hypothetical protein
MGALDDHLGGDEQGPAYGPGVARAIERVRSGEPFGVQELVDSGLLYWINRQSFHPMGFKLVANEDGSLSMLGNGSQMITHDTPIAQNRNTALLQTFQKIGRPPLDWFRNLMD